MNTKTIHQNLLRLAVTLAVVMMTTASALAETTYSYITDLMLIGKNNKTEAEKLRNQYVAKGWTAIDQDLNAGCGSSSDYIYLLYKVGSLSTANQSFITGIYISTDKISKIDATRTIEGRQYNLVPYDGDNHFKEKKGDLNSNAGGDDIHLYYTTDYIRDGKAISSIVFNGTQDGAMSDYDLNTGTNGNKIYMHCTRNYAPQWIIAKSIDGSSCVIKGLSGTISTKEIKAFPSIVDGVQVVDFSIKLSQFENLETVYFNENLITPEMISMNGCKKLQHVHTVDINGNVKKSDELPSCITSIPNEGFSGCSALTSITIPASVTSIGELAFNGCTGLTSVTIKNGVTSIGQGAFTGCTGLTSLTIPGSVTSIGQGAFTGCAGLTRFTIPASVTSIGQDAFKGCSKLEIIYVDIDNPNYTNIDGVLLDKAGTSILVFPPAYPFTNYVIPDGVTNIGKVFAGRKDLTGITIPASMTNIGQDAFNSCTSLASVTFKDGVENIGQGAFWGCTSLREITIPGSVTSIGLDAFSGCTSLKSATIKSGDIGNQAFMNCSALTSVTIENGVKSIGRKAFSKCPLTSITIPSSVTSISQGAFTGCTGLTSITIPGSVTSIGQEAFSYCTSLTNITIPGSVTNIGQEAFSYCTSLTNITIPGSVTSIGLKAFNKCTSLTNITIPGSVTNIGQKAFSNCTSLTNITIPGSVTSIGQEAFSYCTSLTSVTIENGVTSIGQSAFYQCPFTSITIPGSVTSIGLKAFNKCTSLKNAIIENGVESIGQDAFYQCTSLTNITIPGSVTSIGQGAFFNCDNLASVNIMGNPKIGNNAIPDGATVTLSLTANAANGAKWMTFYNDRYNFQADENTTVYKATVVGQSLVLTEVTNKIVNAGTAVILRSDSDPVMTRTATASNDTQANDLVGTTDAMKTPANCFTLASGSKGVGFYRYTGSEVAAGKAYLIYSGASTAREFIGFDESGEATGISTIPAPAAQEGKGCAWYDLYGRKLQGDPAKKGIYVRNGQIMVIK